MVQPSATRRTEEPPKRFCFPVFRGSLLSLLRGWGGGRGGSMPHQGARIALSPEAPGRGPG
eukprot:1528864-Alexandrium_andersonii.AAC.1